MKGLIFLLPVVSKKASIENWFLLEKLIHLWKVLKTSSLSRGWLAQSFKSCGESLGLYLVHLELGTSLSNSTYQSSLCLVESMLWHVKWIIMNWLTWNLFQEPNLNLLIALGSSSIRHPDICLQTTNDSIILWFSMIYMIDLNPLVEWILCPLICF